MTTGDLMEQRDRVAHHLEMSMERFLSIVFIFLISLAFIQTLAGQSPSFKTYINPVIPGDHPDATLTRIGNDFYTTGSSFNPTPVIYHSTDLVHWEAIAQPVSASWANYGNTPGGGCWGGHLVFYNSKYWHFFSRANTMYFVKADNPAGPWSMPVKINNPASLTYGLGYDNSIFIDDDNKWYLIIKNGQPNNGIVELGDDGQPGGNVYDLNWLNPAPSYPYSWAEGPVMWKSFGYYYYSFARDLSGGQKVMRSPVLTANQASWEMMGDFFNESDPLKGGALFTSPNHSSPTIMLNDSTFWVIHPLYAKGEWKGQGRQGLLNQVRFNAALKFTADYPVNKPFDAPKLPNSGIPWMVPKSDFFTSVNLNPEWSFLGYTPGTTFSLTDRPGWLRLSPNNGKPNTLVKNDGEHNYSLITRLEFDANSTNDEAGLKIMRGDETKFVRLFSSVNSNGQKVIVFSFDSQKFEVLNTIGNTIWLKVVRVNHSISGFWSNNGIYWTQVGNAVNISLIDSYSDFTSFTGTRQGIYVKNRIAYFDFYIYRDAYTPIMATCTANQYGTVQTASGVLDSIHNTDWALYAGVEFGTREYGKAADSIHIVASGLIGGNAEIWLDSIDTGLLMGTCGVFPAGSPATYKTFSANVGQITGRHDVYLRFSGSPNGSIFSMKWIQFIALHAPQYVSSYTGSDSTVRIKLDRSVVMPQMPTGLLVTLNNSDQDSVKEVNLNPADSSEIILILFRKLNYTDKITVSYDTGSIKIKEGLELVPFTNCIVDNLIQDPAPRVVLARTTFTGDSVVVQFNKKMQSPDAYGNGFQLIKNFNSEITIHSVSLNSNDSSMFICIISPEIYYEDSLILSYSGTDILSQDGNILKPFGTMQVTNVSKGYPPLITAGYLVKNDTIWNMVVLKFDRALNDVSTQKDFFSIKINNENALISTLAGSYDTIALFFNTSIRFGDVVKISYSGGSIQSLNNGVLEDFTDYPIQNDVPLPVNINSSTPSNTVVLYGSPDNNELKVISGTGFNIITIYDMGGRLIVEKRYGRNVSTTCLSINLSKGVYVIKVSSKVSSFVVKIVI